MSEKCEHCGIEDTPLYSRMLCPTCKDTPSPTTKQRENCEESTNTLHDNTIGAGDLIGYVCAGCGNGFTTDIQTSCLSCGSNAWVVAPDKLIPNWQPIKVAGVPSYYAKHTKCKSCGENTMIDFYEIARAFDITSPTIQHAVKRLIRKKPGETEVAKIVGAIKSLERALEMIDD